MLIGVTGTFASGARIVAVPLQAAHLGASPATVGILYAVFAGTNALAALPTGLLVDRRGSRILLLGALLLTAAAQVLAVPDSMALLFATQVIGGVAWGAVALGSLTVNLAARPASPVARVIGLASIGNQTGLMLGPTVAGLLVAAVGVKNVFLLTALPPLAGFAITAVFAPGAARAGLAGPTLASTWELLTRPAMLPIGLLAASVGIVYGGFQAYFTIFAARGLGLSAATIGWLVGLAGLTNILSRFPVTRILTRARTKGVYVAGASSLFGAALALMPHVPAPVPLAVLLMLSVPLVGVGTIGMTAAAAEVGGDQARGRAIGLGGALLSTTSGLAPALVAPAMNASFALGFALIGLLALGTSALGLLTRQLVMRAQSVAAQARSRPPLT